MGGLVNDIFGQTDTAVAKPAFDPNQFANNGAQADTAKQQQQFVAALQAQMNGNGPAQQLLQQQSQQNQAATLAQAAATRGVNPALALRNAQLANVQTQQQANQAGLQAQLGTQGQLGNALGTQRGQDIQNTLGFQQLGEQYAGLQTGVAQGNAGNAMKTIGGLLGGAGAALGGLANGGVVKMAVGGGIDPTLDTAGMPLPSSAPAAPMSQPGAVSKFLSTYSADAAAPATPGGQAVPGNPYGQLASGAKSFVAKHLIGTTAPTNGQTGVGGAGDDAGAADLSGSEGSAAMLAAQGGKVPAMVSPGERYLNKEQATMVAQGKAQAMKAGELIPGKAKVPGAKNSYENDTVPKTLEAGGVVIPRSVTQSPDAKAKADAFVKAVLSHGKKKGK